LAEIVAEFVRLKVDASGACLVHAGYPYNLFVPYAPKS
jgi:hypothetical protein